MFNDPLKPYNELPPLPPNKEIETKAILKRCVESHRQLASLNSLCKHLPDPTLIINTIPLQEAKASSEIENVLTTQDELIKAEIAPSTASAHSKEVLRYRTALKLAYDMTEHKRIDEKAILNIGEAVNGKEGILRNMEPVVVRKASKVIYTPPRGSEVILGKLRKLVEFMNDNTLDPLVSMAIAHYQFEAIHPFLDGNGRTGRITNIILLKKAGLLDLPVLYLSRFILEHKAEYHQHIKAVTEEGKWINWIAFMLDCVRDTASHTIDMIDDIFLALTKTCEKCKRELPAHVYSKELVEIIFRQCYTKIAFLTENGIGNRHTAGNYLREFEKIGVLSSHKIGRENIYINQTLVDIISR